jgi:hypothetical protein
VVTVISKPEHCNHFTYNINILKIGHSNCCVAVRQKLKVTEKMCAIIHTRVCVCVCVCVCGVLDSYIAAGSAEFHSCQMQAIQQLRQLLAGLSLCRPGFGSRPAHVGLVVD